MPTTNEALQDRAIDVAIDLRHYSNGVIRRMQAVLNRSDARLLAQIAEALLRMDPERFTVQRLNELLASVRLFNQAAFAAVLAELQDELRELAGVTTSAEYAGLRSAVPAAVQIRFPIAQVVAEQVYAAALSRPFQGRLLREWGANLSESRMRAVTNAIRNGFVEGRTTADIIRALRGTRALRYRDGVLDRSRRELATIVQSALSHTAQTARQAFYDANDDLIKAVKWTATLDTKTSPMCRIRDGKAYTPDKHKPIGHSIPWGDGPGRLHFNCRSVSVPVTKSWRELGINADDLSPSVRASMDGGVPADTTFAEWFARQSAARQDEIVGVQRAALYRANRLRFENFYDNRGRFLTLEELRRRIGG